MRGGQRQQLTKGCRRIPSAGFGNYDDVATLEPRLVEILEAIVDTYDAPPPDQRRRLMHLRGGGGHEFFNEWGPGRLTVTRDDLDELHEAGAGTAAPLPSERDNSQRHRAEKRAEASLI